MFVISDEYLSDTEAHQVHALVHKIGRACNSKGTDIIATAIGIIFVDMSMQISDEEADLHEGAEAFCRDLKMIMSARVAAKKAAH